MRIGFETSGVVNNKPTGIARYITGLISAVSCEIRDSGGLTLFYKLSRFGKRSCWWRPDNLRIRNYYGPYWPFRKNVDIIHGLDGYVPYWKNVKRVVTVHDLLALKSVGGSVVPAAFALKKEKVYRRISEHADLIISASETTKEDIISLLNVSPERIEVIYHGIDRCYFPREKAAVNRVRNKYELEKDYLLFVGSISERKNTERLVRAFSLSKVSRNLDLALAGTISYGGEKTLEAITKYHLEDRVKVLGYIEDSDLPALYSGARGFLFPTFYEGFGLPVLEAMACETPALTGNDGAAPEISGDYAIHVDPLNTDEIAQAIDRLTDISRNEIEKGAEYARNFTWERCAKQTLNLYWKLLK